MGVWDSLPRFSAGRGTKRHHRSTRKRGRKKSTARGLRIERFEDRILLSVRPGRPAGDLIWEQMLARSIDRATNLEGYSTEELNQTEYWVIGLGEGYSSEEVTAALEAEALDAAGYLDAAYVCEFAAGTAWSEVGM